MKKLILIAFTLMISSQTFAAGEMASTECTASDQSSRSYENVAVSGDQSSSNEEVGTTATQQ
ncbi:MAG: hypothetical protein KC493_04725 [Bacteriovoracaceae bacterium]|nr:hypothetical protein [Bacteriovoracaceae bacterium]